MKQNKKAKSISGVKMFQSQLEFIKLNREYIEEPNQSKPTALTAASISCHILLQFACDTFGRIAVDDFNLKRLAESNSLPYSSIHKGFHRLLNGRFIVTERIEGQEYYVFRNYEEYNSADQLNYFTLPTQLLKSNVLADLISARDVDGVIGLLDACNYLSREYSINRKKPSTRRNISSLMKSMKKTTRNIMDWVDRVSAFFKIDTIERKTIATAKVTIDFTDSCFYESDLPKEQLQLRAKVRREIEYELARLPKFIKSADIDSIKHNFVRNVADAFYQSGLSVQELNLGLSEIVQNAAEVTRQALRNPKANIRNVVGFWFNETKSYAYEWCRELESNIDTLNQFLCMKKYFVANKLPFPEFLTAKK